MSHEWHKTDYYRHERCIRCDLKRIRFGGPDVGWGGCLYFFPPGYQAFADIDHEADPGCNPENWPKAVQMRMALE